eukprot:5402613-Pleurochrysis_carterae.AAC.3
MDAQDVSARKCRHLVHLLSAKTGRGVGRRCGAARGHEKSEAALVKTHWSTPARWGWSPGPGQDKQPDSLDG